MSRPRVLCVSGDRTTRAAVTLSLTDAPVDVAVAQSAQQALDRLSSEPIDAVVVDDSTVDDVATFVDAVETQAPESPTFVSLGDDERDSVAVVSEVVTLTDATGPSERLGATIADRIVTGSESALESGTDPNAQTTDIDFPEVPEDLGQLLSSLRCRLVGARSPITVEQVIREECTGNDRFASAWVGEFDRGEREIVPWLTDAASREWPLGRTFSIGGGDQPLLEGALETRDLQVVQSVSRKRDLVPLGDHAAEQGVGSVAVAPLVSDDRLYGVVVVYGTERLSTSAREMIRSLAEAASAVLDTIAVRGRLEQRERALERYERLVETAGDGMYVLDDQGHITTVNDALIEMTGYSREGLLGEHASLLFDDDAVDEARETIRTLLGSDAATDTVEMQLETKAGDQIPSEAQIATLVRGSEFLGSVGVVRDITERKRKERRLREQNERLDAFAKIVSHDLRNPLSVSQGYLDLVEETGSLEYVEKIRDGLDRMESIVEDVLAIAQDGEWATELEPVALDAVAQEAWDHVSTDRATLEVASPGRLEADRPRLLRLLENLFRNAIEHGGADVDIRVGSLADDRGFYVEDDGAGLPEEIRDDLFDPSVSTGSDGLGIGLWIVREVATGHGWSIAATESENSGARFEFVVDGDSVA